MGISFFFFQFSGSLVVLQQLVSAASVDVDNTQTDSRKTESWTYIVPCWRRSNKKLSRSMTKPTKWPVCPAKTQISQGICMVWSVSLLWAQWIAKNPRFLPADSKDWSDWVDTQADLSLCWAQRSFVGFVMLWLNSSFFGMHLNFNMQLWKFSGNKLDFVFKCFSNCQYDFRLEKQMKYKPLNLTMVFGHRTHRNSHNRWNLSQMHTY